MYEMNIKITATTEEEILLTLEEVKRKIEAGNLFGYDSREDGITSYSFETEGEESQSVICKSCEETVYYDGDDVPNNCVYCHEEL